MHAYIDESGYPDPHDRHRYSAAVAICIPEYVSRRVTPALFNLKRDLLDAPTLEAILSALDRAEMRDKKLRRPIRDALNTGDPTLVELKGVLFLGRQSYSIPNVRELMERVFDIVQNEDLRAFAIIMPRPHREVRRDPLRLDRWVQFLLQRIHQYQTEQYGETRTNYVTIVFDNRARTEVRQISRRLTSFLYGHPEGKGFNLILEVPLFVDSGLCAGLQLADLAAYCVRAYHHHQLEGIRRLSDPYLSAIARYYNTLKQRTIDYPTPYGTTNFGFYIMPQTMYEYIDEETE